MNFQRGICLVSDFKQLCWLPVLQRHRRLALMVLLLHLMQEASKLSPQCAAHQRWKSSLHASCRRWGYRCAASHISRVSCIGSRVCLTWIFSLSSMSLIMAIHASIGHRLVRFAQHYRHSVKESGADELCLLFSKEVRRSLSEGHKHAI